MDVTANTPAEEPWRLTRDAGVNRGRLCLKLMLGLLLLSAMLVHRSHSHQNRLPWQKLALSVDGVSLGQTRKQVESRLGEPIRVFPKAGLMVLSYGRDFDPARFEFSATTVGLDKLSHAVRISGQSLRLANFRPLGVGLTTSEVTGWLGPPGKEHPSSGWGDNNFYWSYRRDNVSLTVTFSYQTRTVTRFILQSLP
jgi:hypothetical protein